ncbi:MAG: hypothetical protein A2792_09850 [Sphingomonadales bacterium RIFCSPHIGHO2_01_FULL_65_20]|nr:MAG: hypothetical protein A2792_09850 [Sphingomonadales bacterium RIFCSPHIGHO2_01_FULL_65_20]
MTTDMTSVIAPRSDQLNSDDLIAGPRTIRIRDVSIRPGTEQPISIFFDGDDNKPWKCCKSMARVLVAAWGPDARQYVGRSVTLFRDPTVKWAGMEVGGIRISHLSHIDKQMTMALTATKGKRAPYVVKPLPGNGAGSAGAAERPTPSSEGGPGETDFTHLIPELETAASKGTNQLRVAWEALQPDARKALAGELPELKNKALAADASATPEPAGDEPTGEYDGV